jgi:flagellar biosynthetic protein FliR
VTLDSALVVAFLAALLRTSAMVLASPLFTGTGTPVMVRVFFAAALALALAPVLQGNVVVPATLYDLTAFAAYEIAVGLVIGFLVQMILLGAQVAGAFLDIQVGLGMGSLLAPNNSMPASILSRFKFMLAMMVFISLNGHHMLFSALIASYDAPGHMTVQATLTVALLAVGRMSLLALQIALPVAAVSFIVDACLGIVSRAVPQVNVLMAGISAKMMVGMIALSLTLPAVAMGVSHGLNLAQDLMIRLFR